MFYAITERPSSHLLFDSGIIVTNNGEDATCVLPPTLM